MKVWIKYLLGALLGFAFSFLISSGNVKIVEFVNFVTEIVIRFGRYMVLPVVFFTAITAFNRLRGTNLLVKTGLWTFGVSVISSLVLTIVGFLSISIIKLPRVSILEEEVSAYSLGVYDLFRSVFPYSGFEAITNGNFLLPAFFLAMLIGCASVSEEIVFKPVLQLTDSLSKLFYNISVFFTEFLSFGMIAILCYWAIQFRAVLASAVFVKLILLLFADLVIVAGIIYPLIIRYLCHDPHPYRILYASLCSIITAFFSGDSNLVLQLNMRHGKESLGIRRRVNGVTFPFFSIFARGGSALVTTVCFIVTYRSYSSLSIPIVDALFITLISFGISFLLGGFPTGGAFISLAVLCGIYSNGFQDGFKLLKPVAPVLCSFAAAFDVLTAMFGSYIVAVKTKLVEHHGIKHYI